MNYQKINCWLTEHNIILEQGFVETIREMSRAYKKTPYKPDTSLCHPWL